MLNVRSIHDALLSVSAENRFKDQIRRIGMMNHWAELIRTMSEERTQDRSGVVSFRIENRK
jgi:hypothetical protein